jgi:hypothetical protein
MRARMLIRVAGVMVGLAWLLGMLQVLRWHLGPQSAIKITEAALVAMLAVAMFIGWCWLFERRARIVLEKWASEHRY